MSMDDALSAIGNPAADMQDALDVAGGKSISCQYSITPEGGRTRTCQLQFRRHEDPHLDAEGRFDNDGNSVDY